MKNTKMTALALTAIILSFAAAGCDDDEEQRSDSLSQLTLEQGTYASDRCYKNRVATQLAAADRWSFGDITFNTDGTGSAHYTVYSDANCTTQVDDVNVTFPHVSVVTIGSVQVVRAEQDATIVDPIWWIPLTTADGGYNFDVDYTDGQSGPYLIEPSVADLEDYRTNTAQGVTFEKQ